MIKTWPMHKSPKASLVMSFDDSVRLHNALEDFDFLTPAPRSKNTTGFCHLLVFKVF